MRFIVPFNDDWLYTPRDVDANTPDSTFEPVTLPHTNIELPSRNFDNMDYQFTSTYRKRFSIPERIAGSRVYIDFEGVMTAAQVSINGRNLGEHDGGFVPFSFDITDHLTDSENLLTVKVDSSERPDIPPNGNRVDYLTFGGIYREVALRLVEPVHIQMLHVRTLDALGSPCVEIDVWVQNQSGNEQTCLLRAGTSAGGEGSASITVAAGRSAMTTIALEGGQYDLWTLDAPTLYTAFVALFNGEATADRLETRFGVREAVFKADGFYLNGERLKLIGLNRHQTYPYIGAAAPARLQRQDADILKHELGINIARTSHYPQSPHFLDRCDEIGLLVFEEIPGWQWIGDEDWKALSLRDVQVMIERDRNHPSIILWGVRINESWDDSAFYSATNNLAHQLDATRQTGGVRFFQESEFLEDVFTYNDFSNTVVEPLHTPHLVTEFNGHMFPTKTSDQEERQMEHAVRHARIQDQQMGMDNVCGAIGWCAFDYNTHDNFGSGDRICYHGVMDIFRLPKFAADFYASQTPPSVRPVLQAATFWTMGDRSGGGNSPLIVFSNCDAIQIYYGDSAIGRFEPDRAGYPHLAHPPYTITAFENTLMWGQPYSDLRIVGLVDDQPVIEQRFEAGALPKSIELTVDDAELDADGADMTRVIVRVTDKYGNRLPYANTAITFGVEGPGAIIGENPFVLIGGQGAVYLKTTHDAGTITVTASAPRLGEARVVVESVAR